MVGLYACIPDFGELESAVLGSTLAARYHACGRLLVPIWVCAMHSVENVDVRGYPIPSQNGRASCSMATLCAAMCP